MKIEFDSIKSKENKESNDIGRFKSKNVEYEQDLTK